MVCLTAFLNVALWRYEEVERLLIDEFGRAQRDEKKMAAVAKILSEFKVMN